MGQKRVFISLGSNIPPKRQYVERAIAELGTLSSSQLVKVAPLYRSSAVGGPRQSSFVNSVVELKTSLNAHRLLHELHRIEHKLGRKRSVHWGPRTIDLDIISMGGHVLDSKKLKIPHPLYHQRKFVLAPMVDVAPIYKHPRLRKTHRQLLRELTDPEQRVTILGRWKKQRFYPSKTRKNAKIPSSH